MKLKVLFFQHLDFYTVYAYFLNVLTHSKKAPLPKRK